MTWLNWLLLVGYLVLAAGPLRRRLFGGDRWRFSVAFTLGAVVGVVVGMHLREAQEAWLVPSAMGLFLGLGFGSATRRWLDGELRKS